MKHPEPSRHGTCSEDCALDFARLAKLSDEALMAHLQAGHGDALAVLFDRYHRLVVSVALLILRDTGEAEDVMQAVFFEIYNVAAQFNPVLGTTKAWIMRYARHRSINRKQYLNSRSFYDHTQSADLVSMERPEASFGPSLALPEIRDLVAQGLNTLNEPQRRTLEMAYFEGMTFREIAAKTGETLVNVRHHYYRGITRLRAFVLENDQAGKETGAKREKTAIVRRGTVDAEA
jgi:RNA polymerase sigma-70 factor (ECF subfamily)